jgi:IMP dehydrogenase/GMP reductase
MTIFAGNVVTPEMTEQLLLSGADVVKVGIGPGSVCTTRKQTGVGYPQLSAVLECAEAAHGLGGHVISDGGCTCPGDFSKAFGAGADFIMSGGMFAVLKNIIIYVSHQFTLPSTHQYLSACVSFLTNMWNCSFNISKIL